MAEKGMKKNANLAGISSQIRDSSVVYGEYRQLMLKQFLNVVLKTAFVCAEF